MNGFPLAPGPEVVIMVRTWKIGAAGSVLLSVALTTSCLSSSGDDDSGSGAKGGTGTGVGGVAGVGGVGAAGGVGGTAGQAVGGTAGAGAGGTSGAGAGGVGGAGAAGASGSGGSTGPFTCKATPAECNMITDFPVAPGQWGLGDFHGGVSVFGTGLTRMEETDTTKLHVAGTVAGYGRGFNLWISYCSSLTAFTGITFTASGTSASATAMNMIDFQLQTNSTYPWEVAPADMKGGCTAPTGMDPWSVCLAPTLSVPLGDAPQTVTWAQMMGGAPAAWDATVSPGEIIGIQWQFPWAEGAVEYAVDVTIDDVKFEGAAMPIDCGTYMASGGSGGMAGSAGTGGAGDGGGGAGGAGAGGAGAGGAGAGGAGAGGAGAGGAGAGGAGAGGAGSGGAGAGGAGAGGAGSAGI